MTLLESLEFFFLLLGVHMLRTTELDKYSIYSAYIQEKCFNILNFFGLVENDYAIFQIQINLHCSEVNAVCR